MLTLAGATMRVVWLVRGEANGLGRKARKVSLTFATTLSVLSVESAGQIRSFAVSEIPTHRACSDWSKSAITILYMDCSQARHADEAFSPSPCWISGVIERADVGAASSPRGTCSTITHALHGRCARFVSRRAKTKPQHCHFAYGFAGKGARAPGFCLPRGM